MSLEGPERHAEGARDGSHAEDGSLQRRYTLQVARASELFIRSFKLSCNTQFKPQIAEAVHKDTLRRAMAAVDVGSVLDKPNAHRVFKRCYGYRSTVTPEDGVRGLLRESLQLYSAPLQLVLADIHMATVAAAEAGIARSGVSSGGGPDADHILREQLLDAAKSVLGAWHAQTWGQLSRNLHAEAEFPAADRFASLKLRLEALLAQATALRAARQAAAYKKALDLAMGAPGAPYIGIADATVTAVAQAPGPPQAVAEVPGWSEFYMGWLEKRNRYGQWQRRWFALSVRQQRLWYFRHPEEQPARGLATLAGAVIVPQGEGHGELAFELVLRESLAALAGGASGRSSVTHGQSAFTGAHTKTQMMTLTLRAATAGSKEQWMGMIKKAVDLTPAASPAEAAVGGVLDKELPPGGVSVAAGVAAHGEYGEAEAEGCRDSPLQRKISTQVFPEAASSSAAAAAAARKPAAAGGSEAEDVVSATDNAAAAKKQQQDEEIDEEAAAAERLAAELELFAEIEEQAGKGPSEEESALLECVTQAVREYAEEAEARLAEQASKIIADGMLPLARCDDLHAALLRVLVPPAS